jgi:hypothetical protein
MPAASPLRAGLFWLGLLALTSAALAYDIFKTRVQPLLLASRAMARLQQ